MKKGKAFQIIEQNKKSYNIVAGDFSATRREPWPEFELLKPYVKEGTKILDWGCGNGRLLKFLIFNFQFLISNYIGIDQSEGLLKTAKEEYPDADFRITDVFRLPFEDGEFDVVAAIASFHHIPSEELRLAALREIHRVLKPGGIVFMTNWNLWQMNLVKKYKLRILDFLFSRGGMDAGDFWIPFHTANQKVMRYYHHFSDREIKHLAKKAGFTTEKLKNRAENSVWVLKK